MGGSINHVEEKDTTFIELLLFLFKRMYRVIIKELIAEIAKKKTVLIGPV